MPIKREKNEKLFRYVDTITYAPLKAFAENAVTLYSSEKRLNEANEVIDVMMAMLKKKNLLNANGSQAFVEIMVVAGLVHNLFYDGSLHSVFYARERLTPLAKEHEVPEMALNQILQAVEGQFGDDMPIEACRPNPSTPIELFAWAVWFVEEYQHDGKLMPMEKPVNL